MHVLIHYYFHPKSNYTSACDLLPMHMSDNHANSTILDILHSASISSPVLPYKYHNDVMVRYQTLFGRQSRSSFENRIKSYITLNINGFFFMVQQCNFTKITSRKYHLTLFAVTSIRKQNEISLSALL